MFDRFTLYTLCLGVVSVFAQDDDPPSNNAKLQSIGDSLNLSATSSKSLLVVGLVLTFLALWWLMVKFKK